MAVFVGYSSRFGVRVELNDPGPHNTSFIKSYKTRDFGHFWPFSWAIAHRFGVRAEFKRSGTPSHEFNEIVKKIAISDIDGYRTQFLGAGVDLNGP